MASHPLTTGCKCITGGFRELYTLYLFILSDHNNNAFQRETLNSTNISVYYLMDIYIYHFFACCSYTCLQEKQKLNLSRTINYRSIALSSMFCKILDTLIMLLLYVCLTTSEVQLCLKKHYSTIMCSVALYLLKQLNIMSLIIPLFMSY